MITTPREEFKLTIDILDQMIWEDGWEELEVDQKPYKHDMSFVNRVSKRLSDGKCFAYSYVRSYNNGLLPEFLEFAREVFPKEKLIIVYEYE